MALALSSAGLSDFSSRAGKTTLLALKEGIPSKASLCRHGQWVAKLMASLLPQEAKELRVQLGEAQQKLASGECSSLGQALGVISPSLRARLHGHLPQHFQSLLSIAQEPHYPLFRQNLLNCLRNIKATNPNQAQIALSALNNLPLPKDLASKIESELGLFSGNGSSTALFQHYSTVVSREIAAHPEALATFAVGGMAFQGARYLTALRLRNAAPLTRLVLPSIAGWAVETPAITASSLGLAALGGQRIEMSSVSLMPSYLSMGVFRLGTGVTGLGLRAALGRGAGATLSTTQQALMTGVSKTSALLSLHGGHQLTAAAGYEMGDTSLAGSLAQFAELELTGAGLGLSARYRHIHHQLNTQGSLAIQGAFRSMRSGLQRSLARMQPLQDQRDYVGVGKIGAQTGPGRKQGNVMVMADSGGHTTEMSPEGQLGFDWTSRLPSHSPSTSPRSPTLHVKKMAVAKPKFFVPEHLLPGEQIAFREVHEVIGGTSLAELASKAADIPDISFSDLLLYLKTGKLPKTFKRREPFLIGLSALLRRIQESATSTLTRNGVLVPKRPSQIDFSRELTRDKLDQDQKAMSALMGKPVTRISWLINLRTGKNSIDEFEVFPSKLEIAKKITKFSILFRWGYDPKKDKYFVLPSLGKKSGPDFFKDLRSSPIAKNGDLLINPNDRLLIKLSFVTLESLRDVDEVMLRFFQEEATECNRTGQDQPVKDLTIIGHRQNLKGGPNGSKINGYANLRAIPTTFIEADPETYDKSHLMKVRIIEVDGKFYAIENDSRAKGATDFYLALNQSTAASNGIFQLISDIEQLPTPPHH